MKWLAIETSSEQVSMALGEEASCLHEVSEKGNASSLVEPIYRRLDVDFSEIQQCIIGQGPGSYNGLRVGYAFLKGLLCLNPLPVIEVPTPLNLAVAASRRLSVGEATLLVLNNARREEIYGALVQVQNGIPCLQWEAVAHGTAFPEKLPENPVAVVSYDYQAKELPVFSAFPFLSLFPSAGCAGEIACALNLKPKTRLSDLEPHYIRAPVPATASRK